MKLAQKQKRTRQYCLLSRSANSLIHPSPNIIERLIIETGTLEKGVNYAVGDSSF